MREDREGSGAAWELELTMDVKRVMHGNGILGPSRAQNRVEIGGHQEGPAVQFRFLVRMIYLYMMNNYSMFMGFKYS